MRMNADSLRMSMSSSNFNEHQCGKSGGVFYIDTLGKLTLSGVTATEFSSGYSGTGTVYYGDFLYYTGTGNFDLVISSSSSFSCSPTAFSDASAVESDVLNSVVSSSPCFEIH